MRRNVERTRKEIIDELNEERHIDHSRMTSADCSRLNNLLNLAFHELDDDDRCMIPCSIALPAKNGEYLITKLVLGQPYVTIASFNMDLYSVDKYDFYKYRYKRKANRWGWYDYDPEYGFHEIDRRYIIAWMPLPEPYKEEENEIN